jgi:rubredoxin
MATRKKLLRVLLKGGVASPDFLLQLLECAESFGNQTIFFGSRQDVLFYQNKNEAADELPEPYEKILYDRNSGEQNIVSSFVCVDVYPSTSWVHAGTYLRVLDSFQYPHQLRVNIVDPKQTLVPLFYGHINFVASTVDNYWYLYINNNENGQPEAWNCLVFTDDLAVVAEEVEKIILNSPGLSATEYFDRLMKSLQVNTIKVQEPLVLPESFFPNYEGFYLMENKTEYWAGFYWRNNQYDIPFLKEVCNLCKQFDIGRIAITPWKTFMVKGIKLAHRVYWEELLGRFGINLRHSSFELNWHLPLLDNDALALKKYIVGRFDKRDVRTFGMSFAIKSGPSEEFTSVVIEVKTPHLLSVNLKWLVKYDVWFAYDFNPNNHKYILYEQNLSKNELPEVLTELSKKYYSRLTVQNRHLINPKPASAKKLKKIVYQCPDCFTVYDERYGDSFAGISAHTPFRLLPDGYCCQLCEQSKNQFVEIEVDAVYNSKLNLDG